MWIDSHAHLDFPELLEDLEAVLERAEKAGVAQVLTVGCVAHVPDVCRSVTALAEKHTQVWVALGVHPHDARHYDSEVGEEILAFMQHPRLVAWGEIGLDYYYDNSPRDEQQKAFREQIGLAQSVGRPIIIHTRAAEEDTLRILQEEYSGYDGPRGVAHCFSGDQAMAEGCLELGFYLGLGGILTFPKAEQLRQVAAAVPMDRILLETDSPFLAPVPHRGRTNQPAFVALVGEKLSEIRQQSPESIAAATSANFKRLFLEREAERL
ncbi:MAG: TatD family hydrolase [Acidobacteriota bacterium]